jgi:hypothetical protein
MRHYLVEVLAKTSEEFQEGRRWEDVKAGKFRRDETTGRVVYSSTFQLDLSI